MGAIRNRKSKFDPYLEEIATLLETGLSVSKVANEISNHFEDAVDISALYTFIKSRELDLRSTQGGRNKKYKIPNCRKCKSCMKVLNTCDHEMMVCIISKRVVSKSCKTSPIWCEKRGEIK